MKSRHRCYSRIYLAIDHHRTALTKTRTRQVHVSIKKDTTKTRTVNYHVLPSKLWRKLKKHLPKPPQEQRAGRPRVNDRDVINGIWYVLWTGCQWKAVKREWFHVSSSTLHERFQEWTKAGLFDKLFKIIVRFYAREQHIGWQWQSADSKMVPAPLGGEQTGKNPTDRGKLGAKIHLLVDERGAPLAMRITGTNEHYKWSLDDLVIQIVVKRPNSEQNMCLDKGYDYPAVHQFVEAQRYQKHFKHRRQRIEPKVEEHPIVGETTFPPKRWVVERTLGWLAKRRNIKLLWCKSQKTGWRFSNWLVPISSLI